MMGSLPQELQESPGKLSPFPLRLGRRDEYTALARSIVENTMIAGETIGLDGAVRLSAKQDRVDRNSGRISSLSVALTGSFVRSIGVDEGIIDAEKKLPRPNRVECEDERSSKAAVS